MKKSYEMDMCNGPLLGKILLFALPLMASGVLQLLFNAADIVVVGRFTGSHAMAAVGSTSSLINLITNVFLGLSVGGNVLVAQYYGAKDAQNVRKTVHTSILISFLSGCVLVVLGIALARPLLLLMGTPDDVIEHSVLYMRIYFAGMPAMMLYNFGAAILRAIGDTKRPLYFLLLAGIVNVILNLFTVIVLDMGVAGVALATVTSQAISAVLVVLCLMRSDGMCKLVLKELRIHKQTLFRIIQIGVPAGVQGAVFSISNVLIQSSINSFGSIVMAGNTAGGNIEGFVYTAMNSLHQTALSFTSQNVGAKKYKRIGKIMVLCVALVSAIGIVLGCGAYLLGNQLLRIYSTEQEVIHYGLVRMLYVCVPYFLCGIMDVLAGSMRGMGYSITPTIVSLTGACLLRIVWIYTVFAWNRTLPTLYLSYPVTWFVTAVAHFCCYVYARKKYYPNRLDITETKQEQPVFAG